MHFIKTVFLAIVGLGAMSFAAPVEATTAVDATSAAPQWDHCDHGDRREREDCERLRRDECEEDRRRGRRREEFHEHCRERGGRW